MQETHARKPPLVRLLAYAGAIFTAPFRADPESVASLSVAECERLRRARLLRLILVVVILSILGLAYPAGIARPFLLNAPWVAHSWDERCLSLSYRPQVGCRYGISG